MTTKTKAQTSNEQDQIRRYLERNPIPLCMKRGMATTNKTGRTSWAAMARTGRTER